MTKHKLPVLEDKTLLPTGKSHVSYSEISDWMDCSFRHKLKYIDKIDLEKPSIHTEYGSAIHDALENFILTRNLPDAVSTENAFRAAMKNLEELHNLSYSEKEIDEFAKSIAPILTSVPLFLDSEFPGWTSHAAELALMESIEGQTDKKFKGFIDTVIKVPRTARKLSKKPIASDLEASHRTVMRLSELKALVAAEAQRKQEEVLADDASAKKPEGVSSLSLSESPSESSSLYYYYILDWKTTNYGWPPDKKRDFQKQLQLVLYKHFFCKFMNLPLEQVKCGFVLLKRTPRKSDNSRIELVPVSVGPKTQEKGLKIMHDMINQIKTGRTIKNRESCRFCVYNGTMHCT